MNTNTVAGIIRAVLAALAGFLAGKGFDISGLIGPEFSGALATVAIAAWSVYEKRKGTTPPAP